MSELQQPVSLLCSLLHAFLTVLATAVESCEYLAKVNLKSTVNHLLGGDRGHLRVQSPNVDIQQARTDTAETIIIGVPIVVGCVLLLLFLYWLLFLRDREGTEDLTTSDKEGEENESAGHVRACAVGNRQKERTKQSQSPDLWRDYMEYRLSKSVSLSDQSNVSLNLSDDNSNKMVPTTVTPIVRKMNSNFLPSSSTINAHTTSNRTPTKKKRTETVSKSNTKSLVPPHSKRSGCGSLDDSPLSNHSGSLSFTEVAFTELTSGRKQKKKPDRRSEINQKNDTFQNFFDPVFQHEEPKSHSKGHHRGHTTSTDLTVHSQSSSRPNSFSRQSRGEVDSGSGQGDAVRPGGRNTINTQPSFLESVFGKSERDRALEKADAERLEEGLKSLSLVVDLEDLSKGDFRKTYSLVPEAEETKCDKDSTSGGFLSVLGSFTSFSFQRDEDSRTNSPAREEKTTTEVKVRTGKADIDSDIKATLINCSPAELVRAIERMRVEIDKMRSAVGLTTRFQKLPAAIDDSIFIIKSTALYVPENKLDEIRDHINGRSTSKLNKIAELAALELVPCGSIGDRELRRLREYSFDLVRCCRELRRNPRWEWVPPSGRKERSKRVLSDKEQFQIALNPRSSIEDLDRQNTIHERNKTATVANRMLEQESDSDDSFMSDHSLQESDTKSIVTTSDIERVKAAFSVVESPEKSELLISESSSSDESSSSRTSSANERADKQPLLEEIEDTSPVLFSEGSFNMASVYDKGLSFQEVSNPAIDKIHNETNATVLLNHNDSEESVELSDIDSDSMSPASAENKSTLLAGDSNVTSGTIDTEESNVFRVTDDKPTPQSVKSPIVPKLGLEFVNSPVKTHAKTSCGKLDIKNTIESSSCSSSDSDDNFFSDNAVSLSGMVPLGSGRLGSLISAGSRSSFGSDIGESTEPGARNSFSSPRLLGTPRSGQFLPSPRQGFSQSSPRDEDYPVAKQHRRTSRHSLIPEGHKEVSVVPPVRSTGLVPTPIIYSSHHST